MKVPSPLEHDCFARMTEHLRLATECVKEMSMLRDDQPWDVIHGLLKAMLERIYKLAESGLRH